LKRKGSGSLRNSGKSCLRISRGEGRALDITEMPINWGDWDVSLAEGKRRQSRSNEREVRKREGGGINIYVLKGDVRERNLW